MIVFSAINRNDKNAGPKAPRDINTILNTEYNAKICCFSKNENYRLKTIWNLFKQIIKKDIIVIQHPLLYKPIVYSLLDTKRSIILIHDITGLRNQDNETLNKELKIFKKFKYIIVHNNKMKEFLASKGIPVDNIYLLNLFDYLVYKSNLNRDNKNSEINIGYIGNLSKDKAPFLYQINTSKIKYQFNLYGLGDMEGLSSKYKYNGSFEPDNLETINIKLGLIWDGNFDESDKNNGYKNYTRYNNPHKLSCYIAAGIPVIAWNESAIAEFIRNNNIGYLISSVYDINNIDLKDFEKKFENVKELSKKVKSGYYTKSVFKEIIKKIGED